MSEVKWAQLNPARGDKSPLAGTLWGDRKGAVSTGFLAKFVDGFSPPPYIHNTTYRAVVIKGQPKYLETDVKTLDPGSYFGSKGETVHQVASKAAEESIIYVRTNGEYEVVPAK